MSTKHGMAYAFLCTYKKHPARDCDEHRFPMCELFERSHIDVLDMVKGVRWISNITRCKEKGSDCKT